MRNSAYSIVPALILLFLALFSPLVLRAADGAPITPGTLSYEHIRESELLLDGVVGHDPLYDELLIPTPYTVLLALMVLLGVPWLLPVLLMGGVLLLLRLILDKHVRQQKIVFIALLAFVVSPTTSVLGTWHSPVTLGLLLTLAALLLHERAPYLGNIALFLTLITEPILGIAAAVLVCIGRFRKKSYKHIGLVIVTMFLGIVWFFFWTHSIPLADIWLGPLSLSNVIFEFGNRTGISVFFIIIACYGFFSGTLKQKQAAIFGTIGLFFASVLFQQLMPILIVVLAVLCGHGVHSLLHERWQLELLRQSLIILVACLGLFLFVVALRERIAGEPTVEIRQSLTYLSDQHRPGSVLSAASYAPVLESLGSRRATIRSARGENIFYARDAGTVYDFLEETGTSHILITDSMTDRLFTRSDQGILFLLPNTQRFVLVHETESTQVWYYIPRQH